MSRWLQLAVPSNERVTDPSDNIDNIDKTSKVQCFQRGALPAVSLTKPDKIDKTPISEASTVPNDTKEPLRLNLTKPEIPKPPRFSVGGRPMTTTGQIMSWDEWNLMHMKGEQQ